MYAADLSSLMIDFAGIVFILERGGREGRKEGRKKGMFEAGDVTCYIHSLVYLV